MQEEEGGKKRGGREEGTEEEGGGGSGKGQRAREGEIQNFRGSLSCQFCNKYLLPPVRYKVVREELLEGLDLEPEFALGPAYLAFEKTSP